MDARIPPMQAPLAITAATMQQATARQAAVTGGAANTAVHATLQGTRDREDRMGRGPQRPEARTPAGLIAALQPVVHKHRSEDDPRRPPADPEEAVDDATVEDTAVDPAPTSALPPVTPIAHP